MKQIKPLPEYNKLIEHFVVIDGCLVWKKPTSYRAKVGDKCGTEIKGYLATTIENNRYYNHRIIWKMYYGAEPEGYIDHIDGNPLNNEISNLRVVSHQSNMRNQKKRSTNTSGVTGVYWAEAKNKWYAQITVGGKTKHIGFFETLEDAEKAREKAKKEHDFHKKHGVK